VESDWRCNVVRAGWEDYSLASITHPNGYWARLAVLITPLVYLGQTWYSVAEFIHNGGYQKYLSKARLLGWVDWTSNQYMGLATDPFPWGYDVLPDHP